jgi:catechol 2,3-dioxygenase-like lactoylglutathione lyase family enzyme
VTPRLDAIGIVASDLQASLAFYRKLGLEFGEAQDEHVEAVLPGGLRVMFDSEAEVRAFDPDWTPPESGQRMGLAFLLDSPEDVDALYQELVRAGHPGHKPPFDAAWGQRYAQVRDPDGNTVDLFARLDG